jgi:hypothetical protein
MSFQKLTSPARTRVSPAQTQIQVAELGSPAKNQSTARSCDYSTLFTASTMCRAEIPNASTSSSGLPE